MPNQVVTSPCVGSPATGTLGVCPQCTSDTDCELLSNLCEPTAYCVHKDSSYQVNTVATCDANERYHPTTQYCRCLGGLCDWALRPAQ